MAWTDLTGQTADLGSTSFAFQRSPLRNPLSEGAPCWSGGGLVRHCGRVLGRAAALIASPLFAPPHPVRVSGLGQMGGGVTEPLGMPCLPLPSHSLILLWSSNNSGSKTKARVAEFSVMAIGKVLVRFPPTHSLPPCIWGLWVF